MKVVLDTNTLVSALNVPKMLADDLAGVLAELEPPAGH